jgi:hypothetical protein
VSTASGAHRGAMPNKLNSRFITRMVSPSAQKLHGLIDVCSVLLMAVGIVLALRMELEKKFVC